MGFPLEGQAIVLTGEFDFINVEDARWNLIAKGARVMTSVSKTTAAVVAGSNPKNPILNGAKKHGTPVLGPDELRALLSGATLAQATSSRQGSAATAPLAGQKVAISGKLARATLSALQATLERLGAKVTKKPSSTTDLLVVGQSPSMDALDALDDGVSFLSPDDVAELERGTPLDRFIGRRDLAREDPAAFVAARLDDLLGALVALDTGGEVWEDELSMTLQPNGRITARLRELGGTPTEEHVRRVLQREDWPSVTGPCSIVRPLTFGT